MPTTPREMFQLMQEQWSGQSGFLNGDLLADDVVIEVPFAPPGRPNRFEGKQEWLAFAAPQRAAFPIRIDACRTVAVHDTADPGTLVVEYELSATSTATNRSASAAFIGVLRVRDNKIVLWREYQNTMAMLQALA